MSTAYSVRNTFMELAEITKNGVKAWHMGKNKLMCSQGLCFLSNYKITGDFYLLFVFLTS